VAGAGALGGCEGYRSPRLDLTHRRVALSQGRPSWFGFSSDRTGLGGFSPWWRITLQSPGFIAGEVSTLLANVKQN